MSFNQAEAAQKNAVENLRKYFEEVLNVSQGKKQLKLISLQMPDPKLSEEFERYKKARSLGVTVADPVKATLSLLDDGKEIDRGTVTLLSLPTCSRWGSYVVKGNEYAFPIQKRRLPGVYSSSKDDGTVTSVFNSGSGVNYKLYLRDGGDFVFEASAQNSKAMINAYALLIGFGYSPDELKRQWGSEVFESVASSRGAKNSKEAMTKLYQGLKYETDEPAKSSSLEDVRAWVLNYWDNKSSFDAENMTILTGAPHDKMSPKLLLDTINKQLKIAQGKKEDDSVDSLLHAQFSDVGDFMVERLNDRSNRAKIKRQIAYGVGKFKKVNDIVYKDLFQKPIISTFTSTDLARAPKQNNPMDMQASFSEITVRGEGGIQLDQAVTRDVRAVDPSHFGFVDPLHTPEGSNIGTTFHLAMGAKKIGRDLVTSVYDVKTGKAVDLNPRQMFLSVVAFADELKDGDGYALKNKPQIKCMHKGEIANVPKASVQYVMPKTTSMFGANTVAIPFLGHNNGTRGMTAAKMQSQAKPLKYREAPKVQAATDETGKETVESKMGKAYLPKSPVDGVVVSVKEPLITIKDGDGKKHTVEVPKDYWLNEGNFVDSTIIVKPNDKVKKGQVLADSNYTKDGVLALGTNLRTAYVAFKGLNHEDGVVVSEGAAEKLTSMHAHQIITPIGADEIVDRAKFKAYFPALYPDDKIKNIGDDGLAIVGSEIHYGQPLVLKMRKAQEDVVSKQLQNVSRLLASDYRDTSEVWEKKVVGIVSEVKRRGREVFIVVKTEEPARIGDKLVGRYGNKGTITAIIPNEQMPKNEAGEPLHLLLNPSGVPGRMNLGQVLETTASRLADKDGKPYVAKPFGGNETEEILKKLKARGMKDHAKIFDPGEDQWIEGVNVGEQYILKLEHQASKKVSARGAGADEAYSMSGQPSSGGGTGGRAVGLNDLYALLAHGAQANIKEMYTFKGDQNPDVWRAIEHGLPVPPMDMPKSSHRFVTMMRGLGVNLEEDESKNVQMTPFLDRDIKAISNGSIKSPGMLRAKDLKAESGGLFDLKITGGLVGDKWSHIDLEEPLPHPTFEKAIADVLNIKSSDIRDILSGDKALLNGSVVDPSTKGAKIGGAAIKEALASIDIKKRQASIEGSIGKAKGSDLNKLHRQLRTIKNFKSQGIGLDEMVITKVPVIPPAFRPVAELPNGDLTIADVNEHYRAVILMNDQLKSYKGRPGLAAERQKIVSQLYDGVVGTMGYDKGIVGNPNVKGLAATIAGSQPKHGLFGHNLIRRRQDTSGTAVVSPDPELNMDTVGIPEKLAWKIYKPYTIANLKGMGYTKLQAEEQIEERSDQARTALLGAMDQHKVLINRAPTLHRFGFMAFKPKLIPGYAVKMPVETLSGFNMDFDGDTVGVHVVSSIEANEEATKMLPSNNLYYASKAREAMVPAITQEYILGLFKATRQDKTSKTTAKVYATPEQAITALKSKQIGPTDLVSVKGIGRTTAGRVMAMSFLPKQLRDYNVTLDAKTIQRLLVATEQKHGKEAYMKLIEGWKHMGRLYAYLTGSSILLSDMRPTNKFRDQLYMAADREVMKVRSSSLSEQEKEKKIIEIYSKVDSKVLGRTMNLDNNDAKKSNNLSDMVAAGARGNPHQIKQVVSTLGLMLDHRQRTMKDPVRGNYSEGLSSSDYWAHSYAQRKGMIDKSQSVSGPGALAKQLTNSATEYSITGFDCKTRQGRTEKVDRHILERVLARPAGGANAGTVITPEVLRQLQKSKVQDVLVRSVLSCEQPTGVCAMCFGHDETGKFPAVGKNVGVTEAQSITERSVQLPMKSFHTGGVASSDAGLTDAFSRAVQILTLPDNIRGKATLSTVTGKVDAIKPSAFGGVMVTIAGKEHKVSTGLKVIVRVGQQVKRGDAISSGVIKPQEVQELRSLRDAQTQIRDDLNSTFELAGVKMQKRTYELATKAVTENARITDPGDCPNYVVGDYAKLPQIEAWNRQNMSKRPIKFEVQFSGMLQEPYRGEDWARQMTLGRIQQTIAAGGAMGYKSNRSSPASFADIALGPGTILKKPGQERKVLGRL